MKYSALFAAFCLTGALATPIEKRAYVTDVTTVTQTVYVTAGESAPTPVPGGDKPAEGSQPKDPVAPPPKKHYHGHPEPKSSEKPSPTPIPIPQPDPQPEPEPEPSSSPKPPANDYQSLVLHHHNVHRSNHSAEPLTWDNKLESSAQQLAKTCDFKHNTDIDGGGYGQNIGYGTDVDSMLTNAMYNGEAELYGSLYGTASPTDFEAWGHFTQMVWKKTETVGCFTNPCSNLNFNGQQISDVKYTVCNYHPPGNWAGEYGDNVGEPLGHEVLTV